MNKSFLLPLKEWIRRMTKAFNKLVVRKKSFEDIFQHVERNQPDHPKVAQLKRQYPLVLRGKNNETDATDPAPSKDDRSNEAQDAGAKCSTNPTKNEAPTCAARDASADSI